VRPRKKAGPATTPAPHRTATTAGSSQFAATVARWPVTYLLGGEPVEVLAVGGGFGRGKRHGEPKSPVNALVEYPDGRRVVRPFRGLRRAP
jgi:hypothetical protein